MKQRAHNDVTEIDFVKAARDSLVACVVRIDDQMLRRWFTQAFNYWYCPAVSGGYRGTMAPIFDLGILLCEPSAGIHHSSEPGADHNRDYVGFLEGLEVSPAMEIARDIWTGAAKETRPEVERIIVGSMILALDGVWDKQHAGPPGGLPWLESREEGRMVEVRKYLDGPPVGRFSLLPLGKARARATHPGINKEVDGHVPDALELLVAHVAAQTPNGEARLDRQVVDACLGGPNMRGRPHEPPPLHRTETIKHTRSTLPGTNAGVTRAEVKLPEDPPISILPSELASVKAWEDRELRGGASSSSSRGLTTEQRRSRARYPLADILLNRKPLVYKRENPRDLVPRHRALVCFVTGAGAEGPAEFVGPSVHPYPFTYVWAKRQTFDLIRDLRKALEQVRLHALVDVDIAVFGVRQSEGDTVVHSKFALDEMPLGKDSETIEDRLQQARAFDNLVPGFFDQLPEAGRFDRHKQERTAPSQLINPHIGAFLRHEAQSTRPYHAVHLVLAGSEFDHWVFIRIVGHYSGMELRSRQSLTLIGADLSGSNAGEKNPVEGDPAWLYLKSRTTSEACAALGRGSLPRVGLETLRHQFVESVMGRAKQRDSDPWRQMRLA